MAKISLMPEGFHEPSKTINKKLFIISLVLIALVLLFYFIFYFLSQKMQASLEDLEAKIVVQNQSIQAAKMVSEDLNLDQISKFKFLLDNHLYWSKIFPEIERLTLPQISFKEFRGSINGDKVELGLSGSTVNFNQLGQQVLAFRSSDIFNQVEFSTSGLQESGGVEMTLNITLEIDELKY